MTGGGLYRVDVTDGSVRQVALRGGDLVNGDGLELAHRTLWAAHNRSNTLTRWRLSPDGAEARLTRTLTDPALQIPTTLAHTPTASSSSVPSSTRAARWARGHRLRRSRWHG